MNDLNLLKIRVDEPFGEHVLQSPQVIKANFLVTDTSYVKVLLAVSHLKGGRLLPRYILISLLLDKIDE